MKSDCSFSIALFKGLNKKAVYFMRVLWDRYIYYSLIVFYLILLGRLLRKKFFAGKILSHIEKTLIASGLFDSDYYLSINIDVAASKLSPIRHYILFGDAEDRMPCAYFSPSFYRNKHKVKSKKIISLLHYYYLGRVIKAKTSPFFDAGYYLRKNRDVFLAGTEPLYHYLHWGRFENRLAVPDAELSNGNDNFSIKGIYQDVDLLAVETWQKFFNRYVPLDKRKSVSIIIPVYTGKIETLGCIYSVLMASNLTPYELVVINDASPDMELSGFLEKLSNKNCFRLLINNKNKGFVESVNIGMRVSINNDVVLLNSDTEVYNNWLDRVVALRDSNEKIGTITPLSNNATIFSYPYSVRENNFYLEIDFDKLDFLISRKIDGKPVVVPTGVGFCLFIRRDCIDDIGYFDEEAFGKGYGEENDFCQRAIGAGWLNVVASNIFVLHLGGVSFAGEKIKRISNAIKILNSKYPTYNESVSSFIRADVLLDVRKDIDWLRLKNQCKSSNVLIICHKRGGGTEKHISEVVEKLSDDGFGVFTMRPSDNNEKCVSVGSFKVKHTPNICPIDAGNIDQLKDVLLFLDISEVHIHSLIDFSNEFGESLIILQNELEFKLQITIHDYEVICPRINLIDESRLYCGEKGEDQCRLCLLNDNKFAQTIGSWRLKYNKLLTAADNVIVPDVDVEKRLLSYYSLANIVVRPHEHVEINKIKVDNFFSYNKVTRNRLKIVIIGAISESKGFNVIMSCVKDVQKRRLPLDFFILGYTFNDEKLRKLGVCILGRYSDTEAEKKLSQLNADVAWLPSVWPETYSYTLSIALRVGLPVFSFDIGAISSRLKANGLEKGIQPLSWMRSPNLINDHFVEYTTRSTD